MGNNLTELLFIVDMSGSMYGLETDTIGGFNATLDKHRTQEGSALVSTVLFNHGSKVIHDRLPIEEVPNMSTCDYRPQGCTALLDAVGGSLRHIKKVQGYMPPAYKPDKTIVVIITDGLENASSRFSLEDVKGMIKRRKELGWEFLFLGANIDAVGEAARLGIDEDRAATFLADDLGQSVAYEAIAEATCCIRSAAAGSPRMGSGWKKSVERDTKKRSSRRGR